ncbi:(2Fe-2S)-binding protein [Chania multitudinisentens]|uniref:(2Fe-2S)-binding protein n=1 Tax=Chania multitudinisentens TaxID=1639108 RepID=UPI0004B2B7E2|nr:(2Fe-2S)-binding protein [Chania multitudinisentens]
MNLITLTIDGVLVRVPEGSSVVAAFSLSGQDICRYSVTRQPRTAFCGMGICQECRVTINGQRRLACQTLCQPGMCVERSLNGSFTV